MSALKERLAAGVSQRQLAHCIDEFPAELEDYFRYTIFKRIHPTWRSHTGRALRVVMYTVNERSASADRDMRVARSFIPFWVLSEGFDHFSDSNTAQAIDFAYTSTIEGITENAERYMNACCKDFLCLRPMEGMHPNGLLIWEVAFLHRTVYDFFCADEMMSLLHQYSPKGFNEEEFFFGVEDLYNRLEPILRRLPRNEQERQEARREARRRRRSRSRSMPSR